MNIFDHDLILIGVICFLAFFSARAGSRSKASTAQVAELEQKVDRLLSQLGSTGYDIQPANNPASSISSAYSASSVSVPGDVLDLIRRGKKIEAIKLYRLQNPGTDLLGAKNAVEQIERTGI